MPVDASATWQRDYQGVAERAVKVIRDRARSNVRICAHLEVGSPDPWPAWDGAAVRTEKRSVDEGALRLCNRKVMIAVVDISAAGATSPDLGRAHDEVG